MSFDQTKQASGQHTEEEVAQEEDLNTEETTSAEDGHSEEETQESEEATSTNEEEEQSESEETEDVESLKAELEKAKRDRDNYKQGMLSEKAKKRVISEPEKSDVEVNEQVVMGVLEKQSEKSALRNTIDPKHSDYIPELVDDANYQEIISYLPRSMDKSSYESIIKSLKLATKIWKEEKGIKEPAKKVSVPSPKTTQASESKPKDKPKGRKFIGTAKVGMDDWY